MKYLLFFFVIIYNVAAIAQIPAQLNKLETVRENITYIERENQGYMELADQQGELFTVWHFYDFIKYEDISTWQQGEKLKIVFDHGLGYGIVREKTEMFYKLVFINEYDPINSQLEICLKTAMTTRDMVRCYSATQKQWRTEYDFIFDKLQNRLAENVAKQVISLDEQLENLANKYFKAYRDFLWPPEDLLGTMKHITAAHVGADYEEMRFKALLNFYF